jgi:hypothetical protein
MTGLAIYLLIFAAVWLCLPLPVSRRRSRRSAAAYLRGDEVSHRRAED